MTSRHGQQGSVTTELVLLTPILLLLLGFVIFTGRVGGIQQEVLTAADEAARAASVRGNAEAARAAAVAAAEGNLADAGVTCQQLTVHSDTSRFRRGGEMSVTVTCVVGLDDVSFAGLPGTRTFTATSTEIIDVFRGGQ